MIAAYVRVSTKDQNPDLKREKIGAWASDHVLEELTWQKRF